MFSVFYWLFVVYGLLTHIVPRNDKNLSLWEVKVSSNLDIGYCGISKLIPSLQELFTTCGNLGIAITTNYIYYTINIIIYHYLHIYMLLISIYTSTSSITKKIATITPIISAYIIKIKWSLNSINYHYYTYISISQYIY